MKIRLATQADLLTIATIHLKGWELAYGSFMTAEELSARQPEKRLPHWQKWLVDPSKLILVGGINDAIDGFVLSGPVEPHDIIKGNLAGYDCEIYSLHTRAEVHGKGLGRKLLCAAAQYWANTGKRALMLWAYRDNAFRHFYEKIGGELIAEGNDHGVADVAYGWRNLNTLLMRTTESDTTTAPNLKSQEIP